ncbi:unnamed protein product [Protopolystoma xenopodis]|uniref:Secreted protein n=1 Tax=Protopolystoma xenopodis TaxID=117903 RepID=A0A3S5A086_9PLAT|nr:unnamed protein product [Protopolystoma xenopodis]
MATKNSTYICFCTVVFLPPSVTSATRGVLSFCPSEREGWSLGVFRLAGFFFLEKCRLDRLGNHDRVPGLLRSVACSTKPRIGSLLRPAEWSCLTRTGHAVLPRSDDVVASAFVWRRSEEVSEFDNRPLRSRETTIRVVLSHNQLNRPGMPVKSTSSHRDSTSSRQYPGDYQSFNHPKRPKPSSYSSMNDNVEKYTHPK